MTRSQRIGRYLMVCAGLAITAPTFRGAETSAKPQIDVILWFDTEDYLLPADDDAAKRLAQMLTERNVRATFKVVGEKARCSKNEDAAM